MRLTINVNGHEVHLTFPDDTTHLSRNHIETIEDSIAQARRGPQTIDEALASSQHWRTRAEWAEANPDKVIPKEDESE